MDSGRCNTAYKHSHSESMERKNLSGKCKDNVCTRTELLLLSGRHRCLSDWSFPGCSWFLKIQVHLLHHRIFHPVRSSVRTIYLRFPLSVWMVQDLLHKIPGKKFSTAKLKPIRYLKYVILVVFVILLPAFVTNSLGMGDPFFCKYICPQGVLEGAIPLSLANSGIRSALGHLFTFKFTILVLFIILSILLYRPFCKWICPLGAIYSLFNRVSFLKIQVDHEKCVGCQKCSRVCKMDVNVVDTPNHPECIRCGECMKACPTDAICYHYGFSNKKQADNKLR